jgi:undecaprenyl-diphosphatase
LAINGRSWRRWLSGDGIHYLVAFVFCAVFLWAFVEIADEVVEGESLGYDRAVLEWLREADDLSDPLGPAWVEELVRDITALGGSAVLVLITVSVIGFLSLEHKPRTIAFLVLAVLGGLVLSLLLKELFDRPRPEFLPHGQNVYTQSFPSGHSMNAAVVYLTLASILARAQKPAAIKLYVVAMSIFVTILVGLSRVYLGVHWPTDVLAGWAAGGAWATACYLLFHHLQVRSVVEQEVGAGNGESPLPDASSARRGGDGSAGGRGDSPPGRQ